MKICLVTNEFPALTETFITTKALELSRRGHEITVIRNQDTNVINASHVDQVKKAGIKVLTYNGLQTKKGIAKAFLSHPSLVLKSFSLSGTAFKTKFKQQLQTMLLRKNAFDIVHVEFSGLGVAYGNTLDNLSAKLVISCRGTAEKVKPISEPNRKAQLHKLFTRVDAIHCVSQDMATTIAPYCNEPQKIFVNRPSIDPLVFKRTTPYAPSVSCLQIFTIGRFTFQKGYLIGLMAMRKLKNEGVKFNWQIVGDGPLKEEMMYHIHALQLEDWVELVGKKNRDEILELYNKADVFLLPSVYEGIANVCLEAMSMELPVVSTKSGGMDEVIVDGENGLLCEVYDVDSIAEKIKWLAHHPEKLAMWGVEARKTILERFTISRQVDEFEAQYANLIK
ncbi:glycosyltransferase family 4 protein [Segetibacter aerophilus]|uniref:Colanic acid biosynthesis glycosyltransferase WcaL n=1 Tax=Segetibacter aerophilus TaxID=670293 RepID=A0A512BDA6_9BACT|nr:glycosyltransferase family 4 protein [Segetibacter aerophilus]GEO09940.1 colanic acid biosynthesis glycosyltransferase WcaL [Segetibacter aerophilus]